MGWDPQASSQHANSENRCETYKIKVNKGDILKARGLIREGHPRKWETKLFYLCLKHGGCLRRMEECK